MSTLPILQSLKESILTANVKAVYGEPIAAQGKTVIPVAKIIYGYGAGAGTGGVGNSGTRGEGGGGAARAIPVGVVEVSDQQTRFIPISDRKKLAGAVAMGIGLGMWLGWRRRRRVIRRVSAVKTFSTHAASRFTTMGSDFSPQFHNKVVLAVASNPCSATAATPPPLLRCNVRPRNRRTAPAPRRNPVSWEAC